MTGILAGMRVVEGSAFVAAPLGGMTLAQLGADVIRFDPIGGGLGDMLLISEEPGIGLGARLAGITGPDPGEGFAAGLPHALVRFGKHEFPLWHVAAPQRAAFAGEVLGNWLWIVLWPDTAGVLLVEALPLRDLRDPGQDLDLPFGPRSLRLPG